MIDMGVNDLMPYAKALSAKSYDFLDNGDEKYIDYYKMMRIVNNHPYKVILESNMKEID